MKEAMKLALEALQNELSIDWTNNEEFNASAEQMYAAIKALEEALAKQEQCKYPNCDYPCMNLPDCQEQGEPVAWESVLGAVARGWCYEENANKTMDSELAVAIAKEVHALYTTPPQRTWVGLTDEETAELVHRYAFYELTRQIEAKLKEKNT
jgi:hypothetical protein